MFLLAAKINNCFCFGELKKRVYTEINSFPSFRSNKILVFFLSFSIVKFTFFENIWQF